jgi:hypothetical protein
VKFRLHNTFDVKTTIYTQFHETPTGETECFEDNNVETLNEDIEYTAYCMKNVPISIINIWFTGNYLDGGGDDAEIPGCCHPSNTTNPIVQYTFKLRCESECVPTAAPMEGRRMEEDVELNVANFYKDHKASKTIPKGAGGHYCSKVDFPCGENDGNVHTCHYSARDGYETFCVPESDSDILGYYPKDYCGPCVGGYRRASL